MATVKIQIGAKVGKSYPLAIHEADGTKRTTKIRTAAAVHTLIRDSLKAGASAVEVHQDGVTLTYRKVGKSIKAVSGGKGGRKAAAVHKVGAKSGRKTSFKRSVTGSAASTKAKAKKAAKAPKAKAAKVKAPKATKTGKVNSGLAEFQKFIADAKAAGKTHKQAQAAWKRAHPKSKAEKPPKAEKAKVEKTPSAAPVAVAPKAKGKRTRKAKAAEISGSLPSAATVLGSAAMKMLRKHHEHEHVILQDTVAKGRPTNKYIVKYLTAITPEQYWRRSEWSRKGISVLEALSKSQIEVIGRHCRDRMGAYTLNRFEHDSQWVTAHRSW